MAVPDDHARRRDKAPGQGPDPDARARPAGPTRGCCRRSRSTRTAPTVDEVGLDAEGAGAAGDLLRRDAGQHEGLRGHGPAQQGLVRAVPRQRAGVVLQLDQVLEDAGRRTAATASRTAWTTRRGSRAGPRSRASDAAGDDAARSSAGRRAAASRLRSSGGRGCARRCCCAAARAGSCSSTCAALAVLFVSAFWRVDAFTGKLVHDWNLDNFRTIFARPDVPRDRAADDRDGGRGDGDRRAARVPVRVLHGRGVASPRLRTVLFVLVLLPLWSSYLARVYAWRLILAKDGVLNWSLGEARPAGTPDLGYSNTAMWIVFSYIWLPFMILPVYAALERIPDSYLEASRDLGARGWTTFRRVILPLALPGHRRRLDLHVLADARRLHHADARRRRGSDFIGNVVYRNVSGSTNNLPFAAAFATVPLARDGASTCCSRGGSARSRRCSGGDARTRIALGVWTVARRRCSCCSRSRSSASTRSTPRTSRAGRSPGSRRKWFRAAWHNEECATRSCCR